MFVEIVLRKKEDKYIGTILYDGEKIGKRNIGFANLLQRKLTSNRRVLKHGKYVNHFSNREALPSSSHDMVYIDSIEADGIDSLLDDIYRFSLGTNNLDIGVPLLIRVGNDEYTYDEDNVVRFIGIEKEVKRLLLEKNQK